VIENFCVTPYFKIKANSAFNLAESSSNDGAQNEHATDLTYLLLGHKLN